MRVHELLYTNIEKYQQFLTQIEQVSTTPQAEQILQVLLARDAVQDTLQRSETPTVSLSWKLIELDKRLEEQQENIVSLKNYPSWRNSLQPHSSAWWWYFQNKKHPWYVSLNWFWNGATLVCSAISASLIIDGIPRFLSGGLDVGSVLLVVFPSLLTLLTSGALTPIGKEARNYLFQRLKQSLFPLANFILSLVLVLSLIVIHTFFYDNFAVHFHNQGEKFYLKEQFEPSLSNYQKAVALNSSYAEARYKLGLVYEDIQEFDKAKTEYQLAVQQDKSHELLTRLKAYNNWGRILILKKEYNLALMPLLEGKKTLNEEKVNTDLDFQKVKYSLLKNLGWAQLELKNYSVAKSLLKTAIPLNEEKAAAYCLLARVFEAQDLTKEATDNWQNCITYTNEISDEYLWRGIAIEKLKQEN